MKQEIIVFWQSFLRLIRFLTWYVAGVAALLFAMPIGARFLQAQYEDMSGTIKFAIVAGFFVVIAAWQLLGKRDRLRAELPNNSQKNGAGYI